MLTIRQNLLETIHGGKPDRFVNQFEYIPLLYGLHPISKDFPPPKRGGEAVDGWGVTRRFPADMPGAFPVHDAAHKVCKDITKWKSVVKMPNLDYPAIAWEESIKRAEAVNRKEVFCTPIYTAGVFESSITSWV
jgi:hypothetical protein